MKKTITLICIAACLFSCQKDLSTEDNRNTRNLSALLLTKRIDVSINGDSIIAIYGYDADDRLVSENSTFKINDAGGVVIKYYYTRYYRDAHGRIITIAQKGPYSHTGNNTDTMFATVTYVDATSNKVDYMGNRAAVFTYDVNNHVSKITSYEQQSTTVSGYTDWSYDGSGNITQVKHYVADGNGAFSFNIGYDFTYDNKINPHFTGDDALLELRMYLSVSPNNLLKQVNHYGGNANMPDDSNTMVYKYNPDGTPATGAFVSTAVSTASTSHFYYE